jgi:hypothetical protein
MIFKLPFKEKMYGSHPKRAHVNSLKLKTPELIGSSQYLRIIYLLLTDFLEVYLCGIPKSFLASHFAAVKMYNHAILGNSRQVLEKTFQPFHQF